MTARRRRPGRRALLGSVLSAVALAGCGGTSGAGGATTATSGPGAPSSTASGAGPATSPTSPSAPTGSARRATRHHRRRHRVTPPGDLPQTDVLPRSETRTFHREMADLWRGIQRDSTRIALPAFFPLGAYAQLKTLGDPRGDWRGRLVGDFSLDLRAAHDLLGSAAGRDRLTAVLVPQGYAHWVPPGVCDNSIGYYEVPNARVVYRTPGAGVQSFGIASMISWRGVWYVVHLGEVLRPVVAGVVDAPSAGPGSPAPSSTC